MATPDEGKKEQGPDHEHPGVGACGDPVEDLRIRGVVHDVRQMLGIIGGRAGLLLRRDQAASAGQSDLRAILQAAEDAEAMLQRLPGGDQKLPAGESAAGLAAVIRQVMALIQPPDGLGWWELTDVSEGPDGPDCPDGRWGLSWAVPEDLQVGVPAQILREVLTNLVLNALDAMPRGGSLIFSVRAEAGNRILTLADTGTGFAGADPEDFFRLGASTRARPGRGVGLAACRELLAQHGAGLTARSAESGGAVLELELPPASSAVAGGRQAAAAAGPPPLEAGSCPVKGVLVVDDEPGMREMLADVLKELGWDPKVAADAAQGLQMCVPGRCSVALVDFTLPDLSGRELAAQLREKDGDLAIVMMTGWANEEALKESCGAEFDLTARKPLSIEVIENLVAAGAALYIQRRDGTDR